MPVLACCGLCWLEVFFWTFHTQPSSVWHKHTRNESASQCNISRSRRNVIHDSIISEFHIMSHNLSWFYNLLIYSTYTCIYIYIHILYYTWSNDTSFLTIINSPHVFFASTPTTRRRTGRLALPPCCRALPFGDPRAPHRAAKLRGHRPHGALETRKPFWMVENWDFKYFHGMPFFE